MADSTVTDEALARLLDGEDRASLSMQLNDSTLCSCYSSGSGAGDVVHFVPPCSGCPVCPECGYRVRHGQLEAHRPLCLRLISLLPVEVEEPVRRWPRLAAYSVITLAVIVAIVYFVIGA
jgi:hypothetical protein